MADHTDKRAGTALVTGGASGIGLAVTLRLLEDGYDVVVIGRHPGRCRKRPSSYRVTRATSGRGCERWPPRKSASARCPRRSC